MENTYKNQSSFIRFLKRFIRHKMAMAAACIFIAEVLVIVFLPMIVPLDAITSDFMAMSKPPSAQHILGTDEIGRDIFARLIYGGRVSLIVGICSTLMSVAIGVPLGVCAGYFQGKIGNVIMRITDMFTAFPSLVLTLVLVSVLEPSIGTVIFATGIMGWIRHCRLLYGTVMKTRSQEYVEAAVAMGADSRTILLKYIIPNSISPIWVSLSFGLSSAIIHESTLSFLGAGIRAPQSSWGNIINAAQKLDILTNKVWMWLPACIVLLVTVVCINMIGEGIRDALDPKMKV